MIENPPSVQKFFEFLRNLLTVGEYIRPVLCGHDYRVRSLIGTNSLDLTLNDGTNIRGDMACRVTAPNVMQVTLVAYDQNSVACNRREVTVTRFTEIEAHILADYLTAAVWLQAESEAIGKADYLRQ
jgi:hypothetical protein